MPKTPKQRFPQLIPEISHWPIYSVLKHRKQVVESVEERALESFAGMDAEELDKILDKTVYLEKIRSKNSDWKVDPPNDYSFWSRFDRKILKISEVRDEGKKKQYLLDIYRKILKRYSEEIIGNFQISTFQFARRFLTVFFNILFNAPSFRLYFLRLFRPSEALRHFHVSGEMEKIRNLFSKGTVVFVPTHSSNLDSILIGYVIDQKLGLPAFTYGAGLNLYNFGMAAYFMNRLGAYRVDRRKKSQLYLVTLKSASEWLIQKGVNSLFFPGGTRSRSGSLEARLKLGLVGTTTSAQRLLCQEGSDKKVFMVPFSVSYECVLEAPLLVEQYLRTTGKEDYLGKRENFTGFFRILKLVYRIWRNQSDVYFSFSAPMDIAGNLVDDSGNSLDQNGNPVDVRDYFMYDGSITVDEQREREYTLRLEDRIVEKYAQDQIILPSYVVATAAYETLARMAETDDIYELCKIYRKKSELKQKMFRDCVADLVHRVRDLAAKGKLRVPDEDFGQDLSAFIREGVERLGAYHVRRPLRMDQHGHVFCDDFRVLYFYRNRLDVYPLDFSNRASSWERGEELND